MKYNDNINVLYSEEQCTRNLDSIDDALYVLGGKWKMKIIIALISGHSRFNDLQRTLQGISARVLSNALKDLEVNELVERVVYAEQTPVVVEYIPTTYAKSLKDVVGVLAEWGDNHKKHITNKS